MIKMHGRWVLEMNYEPLLPQLMTVANELDFAARDIPFRLLAADGSLYVTADVPAELQGELMWYDTQHATNWGTLFSQFILRYLRECIRDNTLKARDGGYGGRLLWEPDFRPDRATIRIETTPVEGLGIGPDEPRELFSIIIESGFRRNDEMI